MDQDKAKHHRKLHAPSPAGAGRVHLLFGALLARAEFAQDGHQSSRAGHLPYSWTELLGLCAELSFVIRVSQA